MGEVVAFSGMTFMRKRPSGATSYCCLVLILVPNGIDESEIGSGSRGPQRRQQRHGPGDLFMFLEHALNGFLVGL